MYRLGPNTFLSVLLAISVFFVADYAWSRGPKQIKGKEARLDPETAKRMDTMKLVQLVDRLELSDEQALKVSKTLQDHREATTPLRKKMQEISLALQSETAKENPQAKAILSHVSAYKAAIEKLTKERESYVSNMLKILNPMQQGKFIIFHESFPKMLRQNIRDVQERRWENRGPRDKMKGRAPAEPSQTEGSE